MPPRLKTALALGASAAALSAVLAPQAYADGSTAPRISCKGSSTADVRLRVDSDGDGRFTVVGVVFSDDSDVWSWRMVHNDDVSYKGEVQAKDADKSFRIQRSMVDLYGNDDIVFRAVNTVTDEVCRYEFDESTD